MKAIRAGKGAVALALSTLCCSTLVHAQSGDPDWRGLYFGAGGAYHNVSVEVGDYCDDCWWGDYDGYDQGDGDFGYTVHAGWRIFRYAALEAGYAKTGTLSWDEDLVYMPEFDDFYNNRVDFDAEVTDVSVLGILPFANWELYLRVGAGMWDGESRQKLDQSFGDDVVRRRVSDDGTGLLGGLGFGVTFGRGWHARFEAQAVTIDGDVLNVRDDADLDSFNLELQYRFGAAAAPPPSTAPAPPPATP
jgi:OOP family OmpA-OmpF porin